MTLDFHESLDFDADELALLGRALTWYASAVVDEAEYDRWLRLRARVDGARLRARREPGSPAPR